MRTKKTIEKIKPSPPSPQITNKDNLVFALDIGTRSVVGILAQRNGENFNVIDYEQKFHSERAMRDGQIEDINLVAKVVNNVKFELEKRHKINLTSVSIAAAGRSLKTKKVKYEQNVDPNEYITDKLVQAIEYCAIGLAQEEFYSATNENIKNESIDKTENSKILEIPPDSFYCVGYSVINYFIDDYPISKLVGHKAKKISVELIAAFLPYNVVQSLYSVMQLSNLTVNNLTLEPIAAINVIVPKDIRLLNIALVDIGAGTSDIAISKNGSIVAYDMVTIAGDEITETIMQKYITNFETAEKIKISLDTENDDKIEFLDILGNKCSESKLKIIKSIQSAIQSLADSISNRILEINETAPIAVFLVGGGSQIPGLCRIIAQNLKISPNYVSIGGKQPFKNITLFSDKLQNPEFITPLGIGTLIPIYKGYDFFSITVNDKKFMMLNYGNSKVIDALLLASIKPQSLIGISPRSIVYYLNGEKFTKRGQSSIPGELYINGNPASIDTNISPGDNLIVKPAIDGTQAKIKISELRRNMTPLEITVDSVSISIDPIFKIGDKELSDNYIIKSMDNIETFTPSTIEEVLTYLDINYNEYIVYLNQDKADLDFEVKNGDIIDLIPIKNDDEEINESEKISEEILTEEIPEVPTEEVATKELSIKEISTQEVEISKENNIKVFINGEETILNLSNYEKNQPLFFDMLNFVDIDTKNPNGSIILTLNDEEAYYTMPIKDGDKVEIRWSGKD